MVLLLEIHILSENNFSGSYYCLLRQWYSKFWLQEQRELPWNLQLTQSLCVLVQWFYLRKLQMKTSYFFAVRGIFFLFFCMTNMEHIFQIWKSLLRFFFFHVMDIGSSILHVYFNYIIKCIRYFVQIQKRMLSTVRKITFSIMNFFSKCDQIHSFLRIWSQILKIFLMENFIF